MHHLAASILVNSPVTVDRQATSLLQHGSHDLMGRANDKTDCCTVHCIVHIVSFLTLSGRAAESVYAPGVYGLPVRSTLIKGIVLLQRLIHDRDTKLAYAIKSELILMYGYRLDGKGKVKVKPLRKERKYPNGLQAMAVCIVLTVHTRKQGNRFPLVPGLW
jgi:hypothetical protein